QNESRSRSDGLRAGRGHQQGIHTVAEFNGIQLGRERLLPHGTGQGHLLNLFRMVNHRQCHALSI
ncbi:hypothetical protein Ciccas_013876, partial [Cichlidogyrus casuarinus]